MSIENRRACGIARPKSRFFLQFRPLIGDQRLRRTPFVTDDGGVVRACRAT
jgi:hypothetical protein